MDSFSSSFLVSWMEVNNRQARFLPRYSCVHNDCLPLCLPPFSFRKEDFLAGASSQVESLQVDSLLLQSKSSSHSGSHRLTQARKEDFSTCLCLLAVHRRFCCPCKQGWEKNLTAIFYAPFSLEWAQDRTTLLGPVKRPHFWALLVPFVLLTAAQAWNTP